MVKLAGALGIAVLISLLGMGTSARADVPPTFQPMIEVAPASTSFEFDSQYGFCPCFRWTVRAQALGGKIETHHFYISSEALIRLQQAYDIQFDHITQQFLEVGAFDALWKDGHIGVSFEGVSLGVDTDRGYSDVFRTGLSLLISAFKSENAHLFFKTGYRYEEMKINSGLEATSGWLPQSVEFAWNQGTWNGKFWASYAADIRTYTDYETARLQGGVYVHKDVLSFKDLALGLGFTAQAERDPFRKEFGLAPHNLLAIISMDLSWDTNLTPSPAKESQP